LREREGRREGGGEGEVEEGEGAGGVMRRGARVVTRRPGDNDDGVEKVQLGERRSEE